MADVATIPHRYPGHAKQRDAIQHLGTQHIGAFIDWLNDNGMYIANDGDGCCIDESIEQLLARYAKIDLDAIEREKRAMVEEMRENQP